MKQETFNARYYGKGAALKPFTREEALKRVHDTCGCAGKHDCDCVSVVNRVLPEMWCENNTQRN
jgi:hypothetical protein